MSKSNTSYKNTSFYVKKPVVSDLNLNFTYSKPAVNIRDFIPIVIDGKTVIGIDKFEEVHEFIDLVTVAFDGENIYTSKGNIKDVKSLYETIPEIPDNVFETRIAKKKLEDFGVNIEILQDLVPFTGTNTMVYLGISLPGLSVVVDGQTDGLIIYYLYSVKDGVKFKESNIPEKYLQKSLTLKEIYSHLNGSRPAAIFCPGNENSIFGNDLLMEKLSYIDKNNKSNDENQKQYFLRQNIADVFYTAMDNKPEKLTFEQWIEKIKVLCPKQKLPLLLKHIEVFTNNFKGRLIDELSNATQKDWSLQKQSINMNVLRSIFLEMKNEVHSYEKKKILEDIFDNGIVVFKKLEKITYMYMYQFYRWLYKK